MLHSLLDLYRKSYAGLPRKVWYLALILLINRSGTMVVPFLTVYLTAERGYSPATAAWVMVAFGLGGVVGNYVGGRLNDLFGSWHIQLFSLFSSGLVFIWLGQVESFSMFCVVIFILSVTADSFRPANRAAVAFYTPRGQLTKAFGLVRMAVNLGFSAGPLLGGLIIANLSYDALFWADGLTCIASGVAFVFLLPADGTARPIREEKEATAVAGRPLVTSLPGHRQAWLLTVCGANVLVAMCFFQLFSTVPVYLESVAYTTTQIGLIFTFSGLLIVAFEMPILYLTQHRFSPLRVLSLGSALIAVSYFLLPVSIGLGMAAILFFTMVLTLGEMLYMPFGNTFVTEYAPPARRGEYLGLLSASYSLSFVLSPVVGLNLGEHLGFGIATYILAGLGALGSIILLRLYLGWATSSPQTVP